MYLHACMNAWLQKRHIVSPITLSYSRIHIDLRTLHSVKLIDRVADI